MKICNQCKINTVTCKKRAKCNSCRYIVQKEYLNNNPWQKTMKYINDRCNSNKRDGHKYYNGKGIINLLTGNELKNLWFRDKAYNMNIPSIDRINPNMNYCFDNCRYIELSENTKIMNRSRQG